MKNGQAGAEKLDKTADFVISLIFSTLMLLVRIYLNSFANCLLRTIWLCKTNFEYTYRHILKNYKIT